MFLHSEDPDIYMLENHLSCLPDESLAAMIKWLLMMDAQPEDIIEYE
jgi:hypothetical protein